MALRHRPERPGPIARMAIGHKLPVIAGALLLLVGVSISLGSYFEVRHTAVMGARQRVNDLIKVIGRSDGRTLMASAHATARRPEIAAYLANPDPVRAAEALKALLPTRATRNPAVAGYEIRDASGAVLLSTAPTVSSHASDFPPTVLPGDSAELGKIRPVGDSLLDPVSARIPGGNGAYVVEWRTPVGPGADTTELRELLGGDVIWLIGNSDGSGWTDFKHGVVAPPAPAARQPPYPPYSRRSINGSVVGAATPLRDTPWLMAIEIPVGGVLAPTQRFLQTVLIVTFLCVAIGALAAWLMAQRITRPLEHLTDAADAIAAGGDAEDIPVDRVDELGRLARSFDTMAQQIRDARQRLEDKVTERTRELRDALQQLDAAQEALVRREKLAMLGQLAGGVGHELRNPLGVMSNAVYYLEMVLGSAPPEVRDHLRLLREQVALSSKIVSDLLNLARITPPQRQATPVADIVDAQLARVTIPPTIRLERGLDAALKPVGVDPVQIGQIVFNLLTNAVQAMGDAGGTLRIAAAANGNREIHLTVSDTGPGITPENIGKIFEPLFTTKARGIGLGLAVSRALAQSNGGDMRVESEPGRGARFTVILPAAAEGAA